MLALGACSGGGGSRSECLNIKTLRPAQVQGARITVDFNVLTCEGDPVPGLTFPGNFEIFEDGGAVSAVTNMPKIDTSPQNFQVYTLMLVDVNMGIRSVDPDLATVRAAVKSFAASVINSGQNRLVAIYAFDGRAAIQQLADFSADLPSLEAIIDAELTCANPEICVDPSNNLNGAIIEGLTTLNMARQAGGTGGGLTAGALAVFTDGKDRAGRVSEAAAITAIKSGSNSNSVFAIAFESDQQDLAALREYGKDGFVSAGDVAMLSEVFAQIAARVNGFANSNYRLQYCTTKRAGDHNLEVKVTWMDAVMESYIGFLPASFKANDDFACVIQ